MGMNSVNVCGAQHTNYRLVGSAALEADHVVTVDGGRTVIMLKGYSSAAGFVQLHNAKAAPLDGAVPVSFQAVPDSDNWSFVIPVCGMPQLAFTNGIYVCFSSTGPTKTLGGATQWFEAYII